MVPIKAHSTEKIRPQRLQPVRVKECLTCPRPSNTKMYQKDYIRPQPVKILQLLMEDEEQKKAKKSSVKKKILPERLGPVSNKKIMPKKLDYEMCTYNKSQSIFSHVRRNLDFNNVAINAISNETDIVGQSDKRILMNSNQTSKEACKQQRQKSLIAAPNNIRNKYMHSYRRDTTRHSKLEAFKENIPLDKKTAIPIYHIKGAYKRQGKNIFRHNDDTVESECRITSNECKTVKNSDLTAIEENSVDYCENSVVEPLEKETCSLDESLLRCQGTEMLKEDKGVQGLYNDLQSLKPIVPKNDLNTEHTSSEVCIDRNEFMLLKCELENLVSTTEDNISRAEENLSKAKENLNALKSRLTSVTRLLSVPQGTVLQCDNTKGIEGNVRLMLDKEIQVQSCCQIKQSVQENSTLDNLNVPRVVVNDTENVDTKYSNSSPNNTDESFLNLENQLDIKHTEPVKKLSSLQNTPIVKKLSSLQNTPIVKKYEEIRSFREYMSLKSTMSFLETPDGKRLHQKNNAGGSTVLNKSYISNKVLTDLQNLYSDSPEST